jgi:hypothetical protein
VDRYDHLKKNVTINENVVDLFFPKFCKTQGNNIVDSAVIENTICKHSVKCNICNVTKKDLMFIYDKVFIHEKVRQSGLYNYEGCKIQVNDKINTEFMRRMLGTDYRDLLVCDLLKYGFPIGFIDKGFHFDHLDSWKYKNHSGANDYPNDINNYLGKESADSCIIGPFKKNPFTSELKIQFQKRILKKEGLF